MLNIVVVGGSGFIGTRLVRRLKGLEDTTIRIIDKQKSIAFPDLYGYGDVRILDDLRSEIADGSVVVNLAAEHRDDVRPLSLYDDVNVGGARNICTVAREKGVTTIVFTSSVAVYGFSEDGTDETGAIAPFNDYGRTKNEAESVFREWQAEASDQRTLVIVRPTVVFGEANRGNVYNLLKQLSSGHFVMIGDGNNRKSMAYVENVAAFLEHVLQFRAGVHVYNYVDKPDFTMNELVSKVRAMFGRSENVRFRIPFALGHLIGKGFDLVAALTGKRLMISSVRIRKFCASSVYHTSIAEAGFVPAVRLEEALEKTIRYEFIESHDPRQVFYSE